MMPECGGGYRFRADGMTVAFPEDDAPRDPTMEGAVLGS